VKIGNPSDLVRTGAPAAGSGSPDAAKAKARGPTAPPEPARDGSSAKVKLSGGLATLKASADVDATFDAKRVAQLKAAADSEDDTDKSAVTPGQLASGRIGP